MGKAKDLQFTQYYRFVGSAECGRWWCYLDALALGCRGKICGKTSLSAFSHHLPRAHFYILYICAARLSPAGAGDARFARFTCFVC